MSSASGDYSRFKNVYDGFVQSAVNEAKSKGISNQTAIQNIADKLTPDQLAVVKKIFEFIGANKSQAPTLAEHEVKILKQLEKKFGAKASQERLTSPRKEGSLPLFKQITNAWNNFFGRKALPNASLLVADAMPEGIQLQSHVHSAPKESARTQADIEKQEYFPKDVQQKLQSEGILRNAVAAMGKEKGSELMIRLDKQAIWRLILLVSCKK